MSSKIIIVDENDNVIGTKERGLITKDDIYRVSALWITNNSGDILLAQRAFTKSHDPGMWGPAVAGTVEENETYESNIYKEAEEEIGIKNVNFKIGPKVRTSKDYNYFCQWYLAQVNNKEDEFIVDKNEVEKVKWFSKEELLEEIDKNPNMFFESINKWIQMFC